MRNYIFCTGKVANLELQYEHNGCKKTGIAMLHNLFTCISILWSRTYFFHKTHLVFCNLRWIIWLGKDGSSSNNNNIFKVQCQSTFLFVCFTRWKLTTLHGSLNADERSIWTDHCVFFFYIQKWTLSQTGRSPEIKQCTGLQWFQWWLLWWFQLFFEGIYRTKLVSVVQMKKQWFWKHWNSSFQLFRNETFLSFMLAS